MMMIATIILVCLVAITLCIFDAAACYLLVRYLKTSGKSSEPKEPPVMTEAEENEAKKSRRRFEEEQQAFQDMMNFNAFTAYKMRTDDLTDRSEG